MDALTRARVARGAILLAAWLAATGAIGTCDYFRPATPEPPSRPPVAANYSTPDLTLATLARGVEDKSTSNGLDVYMGAFAESLTTGGDGSAFYAFFDPVDLVGDNWDPNVHVWTRDNERLFYSKLVTIFTNPYEMTWEPYEPGGNDEIGTSEALLHRKYKILYVAPDGLRRPVAIGAADLHFVESPNGVRWVLTRWQDYHTIDADSAEVTLGKRRLEMQ